MHFINEDLTVIVLSNLNISSVPDALANDVSALILKEKSGPFMISLKPVTTELRRKLVGKYKLGDDFYVPGTVLEIVEKDDRLYEQQRNPDKLIGLIPISDLEFIHRSSWGKIKFEINKQGDVSGMIFYDRFKAIRLPSK